VSFIKSGFSAIGRLAALALLAAAFFFGLGLVVYMSLQGSEIQVPEITGKSFSESEKELASLGLKIKKRADRNSPEQINTVIEQLPKAGDTVKTGQMILVVTSKGEGENGSTPVKKTEEDDTEKIEEMIDDKPKKPKSNSNSNRKKADTTRDVTANNSDAGTNSNSNSSNSNKKETGINNNSGEKSNKKTESTDKKQPNTGGKPPAEAHPKPLTRPRSVQP
jgi:beta-lactam-binding protein with PASTA domain